MEKVLKSSLFRTLFIFVVAFIINITSYYGYFLLFSFLLPSILLFYHRELAIYSLLLIPICMINIAHSNSDVFLFCFSLIFIYFWRIIVKDDFWNKQHEWVFFVALLILLSFVNIDYCVIPLIGLLLSLPIFEIKILELSENNKRIIATCFLLIILASILFSFGFEIKKDRRTAFLIHGNWALPSPSYKLTDLRNETAYSYSEFVDLLNADTISCLDSLSNYEELWIMTPTKSFSKEEIDQIDLWVKRGGVLYLVSDHTDLFGHGRCLNQLARKFGVNVDYSVSFNYENNESYKNVFGEKIVLKSANSTQCTQAFPLISDYLWTEEAYYANANFFGPVTPSGNDSYGKKTLSACKLKGLGLVYIMCDSTIFANFCVFQPRIPQLIKYLRTYHPFARLVFCIPFILFFLIILVYINANEKIYVYPISFLIIVFSSYFFHTTHLNWGKNPQIWTGEEKYFYEGCSYSNISTAYSLACLSGRKPRWEKNTKEDDVIFVGENEPCNRKWRWVKVEDKHLEYSSPDSINFSSLYKELNQPIFTPFDSITSFDNISVWGLFNDRVMNNWWYNNGISEHRMLRIKNWLSWLTKDSIEKKSLENDKNLFLCGVNRAILRRPKHPHVLLYIPKPIQEDGDVYLGNGVSAEVYKHDQKLSLIGYTQYQENSESKDLWIVDYE